MVGGSGGQYIEASYRLPGLPGDLYGKESACNAGEKGLIPGLGRNLGRGHGNPFQLPGESMDGGARWATVLRVMKSWT